MNGQSTATASASASGGTITVSAGAASWTPPAGSAWAGSAKAGTPSGRPNPNQPYGCTYSVAPASAQQLLGAGGPTPGQWVLPYCAGPGVIDPMPPFWVSNAKPAAAPVQVNPAVLAQQAVKQLGLGAPGIEMAPPPGDPQLVRVPTWLWIDSGAWRAVTASASAGAVTTTATATPSKVVWEMGDGEAVTCDRPGTPYDPDRPDATTDCSYAWSAPGVYRVTATVYWSVTWTATGAPGGGNLGLQTGPASGVSVRVVESQAINTSSGGHE